MATVASHANKTVAVEIRESRGSRKTQFLRKAGKIPGIIYGLAKEPVAIALPAAEAVAVLRSGTHIMEVVVAGAQAEKMLIQDVQYDYLQTTVEHIDLLRIDPKQRVKVKVSLEFRGTPKGAKDGGILETQTSSIELEVPVLAIPDSIRVNVEHLDLHQILHAKDVVLPEGAKLVDFAEKIICQVRTVKEEVAAVEGAPTSAEPEVIGKKKEEEGAEGAAAAAKK
ncbi:MAG: 50S ribosomal protein L25 [Phycisphaerales bacterium]|nr:50S ribosomal protein L25 [Phycisphaerales bacterium]